MINDNGSYVWDVHSDDYDKGILGRYRYQPPTGASYSVAKIFTLPEYKFDVFVKVPTLLPLPFGTLKSAEQFVELWFNDPTKEFRNEKNR